MYKIIPVKYHLYPKNQHPIFGELITEIEIFDEAGGPFIILRQGDQTLRFNFDEFPILASQIQKIEQEVNKHYNEFGNDNLL